MKPTLLLLLAIAASLGALIYWETTSPAPLPQARTIPESKRWLLEKYEDQLPPYPDSWYEE